MTSNSVNSADGTGFEVRGVRPNPLGQIKTGGIGPPPGFVNVSASLLEYEKQYLPGHPRSLSGIALRSFLLGLVLASSFIATAYFLYIKSAYWRIPAFLSALCIFHFLEFVTTARYNTTSAQISSFLLSQNGSAYNIAHTAAFLECFITTRFFGNRQILPQAASWALLVLGLCMITVGQIVRSVAMVQAGTNFNHVVQHNKRAEHKLVTTGLYGWLRHPSYFGFFWWGLGTQLVLGNMLCFGAYAVVLWKFFASRIAGEEKLLIVFFGDDYLKFRQTTGVGIPFIK